MDSSSASREISNSIIYDLEIYERVMVNYLMSKSRELYHYNNFPLNYIRSGMSTNRRVYGKMYTRAHTAPDKRWINIYRQEINKEINLKLDPTSSILVDYHFIHSTRRLLDVQLAVALTEGLVYSNKR